MDGEYKFLNIGVVAFKVLAWISVAVGVVSSLIIFIGGGTPEAPRVTGFIGLLLSAVYFFVLMTISEVIALLLELRSKTTKA